MNYGQENVLYRLETGKTEGHVSKSSKRAVIIDFQKIRRVNKKYLSVTTLDTTSGREAA